MKKMISVCLLFVLLLAGTLWIDQTMLSSEKPKPEEVAQEMVTDTEKMTESMSHLSYTKYYVHASEGYVVICQADHETVYCETSIRVEMFHPDRSLTVNRLMIRLTDDHIAF